MGFKICHNCGEAVDTLTQKCPKCGIVPKKSASPVVIGLIIAVVLVLVVVVGLVLF